MHVDGRQDHDGVVHDLLLAGRHLVPGGLVAVLARDCESPGRVVLSLWSS